MMVWLYLTLYIALPASICRADFVKQSKLEESAMEGDQVTLDCEYETTSTSPYLFWYVQYPGISPQNIIRKAGFKEEEEPSIGKFSARPVDKKFFPLLISHLNPSDTGIYFCAVSDNNYKQIFGAGTQLTVLPKTKREIPSVYQLKADNAGDGLPGTVCLVTDFPSPNKALTVDGQDIKLDDNSALDTSSSDVWRYSAVVWDNGNPSKDLPCKAKYDGKDVPQEEKIIDDAPQMCETRTIRENFKTDMSLNGLSFSLLGLRLLVVKGLIFNLVSSAKLWSI